MEILAHGDPRHEPKGVGLGNLPIELMLEIASDLVLEDITACSQVSRQWHSAWTQPRMAAALCHRFFPTQPEPHTYAVFRKACRRFFRRRHGKYTAVVDLSWEDREAGLPCHFEPDVKTGPPIIMAYGGGNIVWNDGQGTTGRIFVDNLYTRKRKVIQAADWDSCVSHVDPYMCAVSELLLATVLQYDGPCKGNKAEEVILIYNLAIDAGATYILEEPGSKEHLVDDWLSIRTWGEKIFISTGPSSVSVLSYDGVSLSTTCIINSHASLEPEWRGFARETHECLNNHRTNFLPNPIDADGFFIVLSGSVPGSKSDYYLVREFSGTTHVATYPCDVSATMRGVMEDVFGQGSEFVEEQLAGARARARTYSENCDWSEEQDEWAGAYGSDEGEHEIFRFVFKARDVTGPDVYNWEKHYQVSVTFSTFTRKFGAQRAFIDDGEDRLGDGVDEWIPRASMLRSQQFLRLWYDSYQWTASRPIITARDVHVVRGKERTRQTLGKRDGLYPLRHANKGWSHRCDGNIHLRFAHDEDFTVLWDFVTGDCVVFDFREQADETEGRTGEEDGEVELESRVG